MQSASFHCRWRLPHSSHKQKYVHCSVALPLECFASMDWLPVCLFFTCASSNPGEDPEAGRKLGRLFLACNSAASNRTGSSKKRFCWCLLFPVLAKCHSFWLPGCSVALRWVSRIVGYSRKVGYLLSRQSRSVPLSRRKTLCSTIHQGGIALPRPYIPVAHASDAG